MTDEKKGRKIKIVENEVDKAVLSSQNLTIELPSSILHRTSLVIESTAVNPPPKVENTNK